MKSIAKLGLVLLAAFSLAATTATVHADDTSATAPADTAPVKKKHAGHKGGKMFMGKIVSSDATALTVTITTKKGDTQVIQLTSKTKIKKDGEPGTLADAIAGEAVKGMLRADKEGKTNAVTLNIGETKKAAAPAQ